MNRRERRNLKMQNKEATYVLKQKDVENTIMRYSKEITETTKKEAIDKTYSWILASTLLVLHTDFGFGQKRMTKAMELIELQFNLIKEKNITGEELVEFVRQGGVNIKKEDVPNV